MDPNQVPVNQLPPSQAQTPTTAPGPVPSMTPPVVTSGMPAPTPATPIASSPSSSKKTLFSVIAGVLILVVLIIVLGWFMYFSPAAQSKRLSNSFMHSITTGDVTEATTLSGDSTAKSFLTTASSSVHGSYASSKSEFSGGKGYYLYTLSGASDKYARTIIEKDNGKRVVSSFVYSNTALALVPSSSTSSSSNTSTSTQSSSVATTTGKCLVQSDFSYFSNLGGSNIILQNNNNAGYSDSFQIEFDSNVATYTAGSDPDPTTVYNDFSNFYSQDTNKNFVVQLEASVNSASPDASLANARNAKVQSDLESSGIPASKIVIQPITNDTSGDSSGDAFFRQVQLTLTSPDGCS